MSLEELAVQNCVPCTGIPPLSDEDAKIALRALPGWVLANGSIQKEFRFSSYLAGLEFACAVGRTAEQQDHHPDILIRWRRVRLVLSTHSIQGLSKNDFIMAAKSELEYSRLRSE